MSCTLVASWSGSSRILEIGTANDLSMWRKWARKYQGQLGCVLEVEYPGGHRELLGHE